MAPWTLDYGTSTFAGVYSKWIGLTGDEIYKTTASSDSNIYTKWLACGSNKISAVSDDYALWPTWTSYDKFRTENTDSLWIRWNYATCSELSNNGIIQRVPAGSVPLQKPISAEEQIRRAAELQEKHRKRDEEMRRANRKAEELLAEFLSEEQLADFHKHKCFRIMIGTKTYEIDCQKRQHNVFEIGANGHRIREHCIYASRGQEPTHVPLADNALAQMLMLETDEPKLLRIANQTDYHQPQPSPLAA
jgi:hypothetical protein